MKKVNCNIEPVERCYRMKKVTSLHGIKLPVQTRMLENDNVFHDFTYSTKFPIKVVLRETILWIGTLPYL